MVVQIDEYATGKASDPFFDCAAAAGRGFDRGAARLRAQVFFSGQRAAHDSSLSALSASCTRRRGGFLDRRICAICRCSINWSGSTRIFCARDPEMKALVEKGRDYSLEDQALMARKQREALGSRASRVSRVRRARADRNFHHAVLSSDSAADLRLRYRRGFASRRDAAHRVSAIREDAGSSLQRARSYMQEKLGVAPVGLWPSEGSVSDEALALAAECGFKWAATDNGVLARTLEARRRRRRHLSGVSVAARTAARCGMLFRDHYLSDLIGFEYSHMDAARGRRAFPGADSRELPAGATRWSRSFSTAKTPGNGIRSERPPVPARALPPHFRGSGSRSRHRFRGPGAFRAASAGAGFFRDRGSTQISTFGSAPRKTIMAWERLLEARRAYDEAS